RDGEATSLTVDAVVLAMGTGPPEELDAIADAFDLDRDAGFVSVAQPWQSTTEARDGIFVAGPAAGPIGERDGLTTSVAAVGEVLSRAVPGRELEIEPRRATIDQDRCTGCRICIETCPYDAIDRDDDRGVAVLGDRLCRGCGACVAACPTGAIDQRAFRTDQLRAEIQGVLQR
ncbi:MAG: 4Fe-4S dicluster domain-containing protein, partial [Halococcoides sp.]